MKADFAQAMGRALDLTRGSDPAGATRTIQEALGLHGIWSPAETPTHEPDWRDDIDDAQLVEEAREGGPAPTAGRRKLGETLALLRKERKTIPAGGETSRRGSAPDVPDGAHYTRRRFVSPHGAREYTLYIPAGLPDGPRGLVLMLQSCTQGSDDFARGTAMNAVAEQNGLIVA